MIDLGGLILAVYEAADRDPAALALCMRHYGRAYVLELEPDPDAPNPATPIVGITYEGHEVDEDGGVIASFSVHAGVEDATVQAETEAVQDDDGHVHARSLSVPLGRLREIELRRLIEAAIGRAVMGEVERAGETTFARGGRFAGQTLLRIKPIA